MKQDSIPIGAAIARIEWLCWVLGPSANSRYPNIGPVTDLGGLEASGADVGNRPNVRRPTILPDSPVIISSGDAREPEGREPCQA